MGTCTCRFKGCEDAKKPHGFTAEEILKLLLSPNPGKSRGECEGTQKTLSPERNFSFCKVSVRNLHLKLNLRAAISAFYLVLSGTLEKKVSQAVACVLFVCPWVTTQTSPGTE